MRTSVYRGRGVYLLMASQDDGVDCVCGNIEILLMHLLSHVSSDLAYFMFLFHFIAESAATLPFFVLSGVKVRFCESLGCGRGTPGHLLMGGGVLKKKIIWCSQGVPPLISSSVRCSQGALVVSYMSQSQGILSQGWQVAKAAYSPIISMPSSQSD